MIIIIMIGDKGTNDLEVCEEENCLDTSEAAMGTHTSVPVAQCYPI